MKQNWAILPYKIIEISGKDNLDYLQGQLTQDMKLVTDKKASYAALCNNKGRIINCFFCYKILDNFYLRTLDSSIDIAITYLKKYILRSKVKISITEQTVIVAHKDLAENIVNYLSKNILENKSNDESNYIVAKDAGSLVTELDFDNGKLLNEPLSVTQIDGVSFVKTMSNDYYSLNVNNKQLPNIINVLKDSGQENTGFIRSVLLETGEFNIYPENTETVLPQNTTLETFGAINYQKGCYVGQEIIARSKYLGQSKRSMAIAKFIITSCECNENESTGKLLDRPSNNLSDNFILKVGDKVSKPSFYSVGEVGYSAGDVINDDEIAKNSDKTNDVGASDNIKSIEVGAIVDFAINFLNNGDKEFTVLAVLQNHCINDIVMIKQIETQFSTFSVE